MKKRKMYLLTLALLAALSLAACKPGDDKETTISFEDKVSETTAEETSEAVIETTEAEIPETTEAEKETPTQKEDTKKEPPVIMASGDKRLTEDELKKYAEYFGDYNIWYAQALTSLYDSAKMVELKELFYNGFPEVNAEGLTDAEQAYIDALYADSSCKLDAYRIPIDKMDEVLKQYFGISYEKAAKVGIDKMHYWEKTGCFYQYHSDTNSTQMVPYAGVQRPNGNIVLFYEHECSSNGYCMVTIKPVKTGIHIVANQKVGTGK